MSKANASRMGHAVWKKVVSWLMIMAMITINIGLFNLLPVPALDGGHMFFMFFELIFRKKIFVSLLLE